MLLLCPCGLMFDSEDLTFDRHGCWRCPSCTYCHTAEEVATLEMQAEERAASEVSGKRP